MGKFATRGWSTLNVSSMRSSAGNGIGGMSVMNSINWYNRIMQNPAKRREVITRYDMMNHTIAISRALDIMAEDISSTNVETEDTFVIDFDEDKTIKQSTIKTLEQTKKMWERRTGFDINFYDNVREMLLYGAVFFKIEEDFSLSKLVHTRVEGYVLETDDDTRVAAYLYNNAATFTNEEGDAVSAAISGAQLEKIPVDQLLILKVGEGPYGTSVLERVYRTWRHLQMIEDAIVVYRIVRAPERRIFYIDVGRQSGPRAEAYIERVKMKMRQNQVQRNEQLDTDYKPLSTYQDFFVATNSEGRSSKIEVLPGGQNLDQIKDMIYFNKMLAIGLRIPTSYMQSAYSDDSPVVSTDSRVGTAYIEELRYAGYILRLQRVLNKPLFAHFCRYCQKLGVTLPLDEMTFGIAAPQSFALYRENDMFNTLFTTVNSATSLPSLSIKFILEKFLHLDKEDLQRNEEMLLEQKGYSEEQIDGFSEEHRAFIVYGGGAVPIDTGTNKPIPPIPGAEGLFSDADDSTANSAPADEKDKTKVGTPKKTDAQKKKDDDEAVADVKKDNVKKKVIAKGKGAKNASS